MIYSYGDSWRFNLLENYWEQLKPPSFTPSARSGHACAPILGDTFFVFGGINANGYLGDLLIYNIISNEWKEITTSTLPPPRTNACMQFVYPYLIIYGGENGSGLLNDFWLFNYQYSSFEQIPNNRVPAISEHQCIFTSSYEIYIFGGKVSTFEINQYIYITVDLTNWYVIDSPQALQICNAGTIILQSTFAIIGGSQLDNALSAITLYVTSWGIGFTLDNLPVTVTSHAIAHAGKSIYVFGGTLTQGSTFLSDVGTSNFYNVTIEYFDCSLGYAGENCTICEPGTYSAELNSSSCTLCVPGTYSNTYGMGHLSQCTPCPYGTFSDINGSNMCYDCNIPADCPIGSVAPSYSPTIPSFSQRQPQPYDNGLTQANSAISTFQFIILAVIVFAWCMYFFLMKSAFFQKIDIFADKHQRKYYEEPYKTSLGGFMTLIFLVAASIFIVSPTILYNMANIVETKTLVPVFTLENQIFYSAKSFISIRLFNYGGSCGDVNDTCQGHLDVTMSGVYSDSTYSECYNLENSCVIYLYGINCTYSPTSYISVTLWGYLVYATALQIEFGVYSSIPDSNVSSVQFYVTPPQGKVFNGLNPTVFQLTAFPSVSYI